MFSCFRLPYTLTCLQALAELPTSILVTCPNHFSLVTGKVKTTPVEAILAEANLPKIGMKATQLCAIALEKSKRIAPENPPYQIAEQSSRQRTKKPSWRTKAGAV